MSDNENLTSTCVIIPIPNYDEKDIQEVQSILISWGLTVATCELLKAYGYNTVKHSEAIEITDLDIIFNSVDVYFHAEKTLLKKELKTWRIERGKPLISDADTVSNTSNSKIFEWLEKISNDISGNSSNNSNIQAEYIDEHLLNRPNSENLRAILQKSIKGQLLLSYYAQHNQLDNKKQKELTHIIVNLYSSTKRKMGYTDMRQWASAIVECFPTESSETYYMPRKTGKKNPTGKLFSRYCNIPNEKLNVNQIGDSCSETTQSPEPNAEEQNHLQCWLKNNAKPWETVISYWESTASLRVPQFQAENNLNNLLEEWPRFNDSEGYQLIDIDFNYLYPSKQDLLLNGLENFFEKILLIFEDEVKDKSTKSLLHSLKTVKMNNDNIQRIQHKTGHFRNTSSRIWDPHPQYEIDAFGLHLHLVLYHDSNFIPKDFKITHAWENEAKRYKTDDHEMEKLQGCYYKGHVRGDDKSSVAVSLCDGMRGHIRTSSGSFFIEPIEKFTNEHSNILHRVYRIPPPPPMDPNKSHQAIDDDKGSSHCAVPSYIDDQSSEDDFKVKEELHVRNKRHSPDNGYTMEVLVAVDRKMQIYHGDSLKSYVLTLMSIVSSIYADVSIGNSINVAVVHILYLNDDFRLVKSDSAGVSASALLLKFCELKKHYNFEHDTALLLTREQICRNASQNKCDTLGLADVGTMCQQHSCAIVQDNGLSAAFTIAHELGHVLSMPHDDDKKCDDFRSNSGGTQHIMSRMLDQNTHPWSWSSCSRHFVTEFLETQHGKCMLNKGDNYVEETEWPTKLAGEIFTDNKQCQLVYGEQSKICSFMPVCTRLWCSQSDDEDGGCRTQHMPWADGTKCGMHRWCQKGYCVNRNRTALEKIAGGWGPWSGYSKCSRTCGGGVQSKTRECNSPAPANGGKYCAGSRVSYRSCSTENCLPDSLDFRETQCRVFNDADVGIQGIGRVNTWIPKYGVEPQDECKLYCRVEGSSNYFKLLPKVIDGTPCRHDSFHKCVNGVCRKAGCDNQLDSDAIYDKCGVCKGYNDSCTDKHGTFYRGELQQVTKGIHYYTVTRIPKGALNIVIQQPGHSNDNNYIALMDDNGKYLLNGKNLITQYPHSFPYAGVTFSYTGANSSIETVTTTYAIKIKRDIIVQILSLYHNHRHKHEELIKYSYSITKDNIYHWEMSDWSPCDSNCFGSTFRQAICAQNNSNSHVSPTFCNQNTKPIDEYKTCNTECSTFWQLQRTNCSTICGNGTIKTMYICVEKNSRTNDYKMVDDENCAMNPKPPATEESCFGTCDHAEWSYGDWEPCSHTCGSGHQNRSITCLSDSNGYQVDNIFCKHIPREHVQRLCNPEPCPEWAYGEETPCSVTCGNGTYTTIIRCKQNNITVNEALCPKNSILQQIYRPCTKVPCKNPEKVDKDGIVVSSFFEDNLATPVTRSKDIYTITSNMPIHTNDINIHTLQSDKYQWRTGQWGKCSIACGPGGIMTRTIICLNTTNHVVEDRYCKPNLKPINVTNCFKTKPKCPEWNYSNWGECDYTTCKRYRTVICQNSTNEVDKSLCRDNEPSSNEACCRFKWRSRLSPCNVSCGMGTRTRDLVCMQIKPKSKSNPQPIKNGRPVPNHFCNHMKKPNIQRKVKSCRKLCNYKWEIGAWSKCKVGCGSGFSTRTILCSNGKVTNHSMCDPSTKPINAKSCESFSHCQWRPFKWKDCNCSGFTKRKIICIDGLTNNKASNCKESERPKTKIRCTPKDNCSCQRIKETRHLRRDAEYMLNIKGINVSIYCHNMISNPVEFITLKSQPTDNYATYYQRRSIDSYICPTARSEEWDDSSIPFGKTVFTKIRYNIATSRVIDDDYTFASISGTPQPYGTAGDCYSKSERCPQGTFSINLENTGFRIRPKTKWETTGLNSTIYFTEELEPPYLSLSARCGGYCGSCFPSKKALHLDVIG